MSKESNALPGWSSSCRAIIARAGGLSSVTRPSRSSTVMASGTDSITRRRLRSAVAAAASESIRERSEEHTSELQSQSNLVCRLLLEKKKKKKTAKETT